MSPDLFLILLALAATLIGYAAAAAIYYRRGVTRGREIERMEIPPHGVMHFCDGSVTQFAALDASDAIEQLRQHAERAYGSANHIGGLH